MSIDVETRVIPPTDNLSIIRINRPSPFPALLVRWATPMAGSRSPTIQFYGIGAEFPLHFNTGA